MQALTPSHDTGLVCLDAGQVGDMLGHLVGIGSFLVLVKVISLYTTIGGQLFFSHVCNGGLMQVLWLGMKLKEVKDSEGDKAGPSYL